MARVDLRGRTFLVTGASSGIGLATALTLAREGAQLVLVARSPVSLSRAAAECEALGAPTLVAPADVTDPVAVQAAFDAAHHTFGPVDGVVHSAAALAYGRFEDIPVDVFDRSIETTLGGTATVARCALACFGERGGNLVVVGSLLGKVVAPFMGWFGLCRSRRDRPRGSVSAWSGRVRSTRPCIGRPGPTSAAVAVRRHLSTPRRRWHAPWSAPSHDRDASAQWVRPTTSS